MGEAAPAPTRELSLVPPPAQITVAVALPLDEMVAEFKAYQDFTERLLVDSDYQQIGSKRFKKKSAWRKYAKAFNISDRITFEEIIRADDGFPIYARIRVEASHPSGRTSEGDHECHVSERCCPTIWGDPCAKATWRNHTCCEAGCSGRRHFSHPGDIPATATTRAKNRAISDLIGAGEVSAEEMEGRRTDEEEGVIDGESRDLGSVDDVQGAPRQARPASKTAEVTCKFCNGPCFDNRDDKRSESYPDFKCKAANCKAGGWQKEDGSVSWRK